MNPMAKTVAALLCAILGASGCARERTVEMSFESIPRDGQIVEDDYLEMREGQAMAVRVVGVQKEEPQPTWTIDAESGNSSILRILTEALDDEGEAEGEVFIFSAPAAGETEVTFLLAGEHEVVVDARVVPRADWEPTVPETNFGGAGPGE